MQFDCHLSSLLALPYNDPLHRETASSQQNSSSLPEIRELTKPEDLSLVVRLQQEIWGFEDFELLPLRLFIVAGKIGGQVLGAFDASHLVAFSIGIPGLRPGGQMYLHSQMLGVLPPYRNTGLGRRMKLKQREFAIDSGLELIEWTFDPLEIKNAFFNIERLGVIVRRYVHNQYGTTTSHLHGGLPTDRLVAEWWIQSARAQALLPPEKVPLAQPLQVEARITVPVEIATLREHQPGRARDIQTSLAAQFEKHFDGGLAVIGFERSEQAGTYLLGPWHSK
jgi:predicted GNAT superfamily acetyltransferase